MFNFAPMKPVFRSPQMQDDFERDGFVVVDFYDDAQVEEVKELYHALHPRSEGGFFPSTYSRSRSYRENTDSELKRIGQKRFGELLVDYQVINGSFIVKFPGEDSYLHVHQDMTLVDETEFTGINIWSPMVDLTDKNGVLYLLPGSHRFYPTYRGHTLRGFYDGIQEEIKDYMVPYYLKAGQAIIFDQSIIHFSPPNTGNDIRIVTNVFFTHKDARFMTCYHDKDNTEWKNKVECFAQELTFMTDYEQFGSNIYDRPKVGKSLGIREYDFPELTIEILESRFGKKRLREYTPTKKVTEIPVSPEVAEAIAEPEAKAPFWKVYTPMNVIREIQYRLTGK